MDRVLTDQIRSIAGGIPGLVADVQELRKGHGELEKYIQSVEARTNRRYNPGGSPAASSGELDKASLMHAAGLWFVGLLKNDRGRMEEAGRILGVTTHAMQEDAGTEGGFLVPTPLAAEVLVAASTVAAVRPISRTLPMKSKTLPVPDVTTKPSVAIVPEEGTIAQSEPVIGQKVLTAKKISALATLSLELEQDSAVAVGGMLFEVFGEAVAGMEDLQALEGDGVGNNFTGLIAAGVTDVPAGGALADFDKLIDALYALPVPAIAGSTWIMHPKALKAIAKLKDTQDRYLFNPSPSQGTPATLLGRPIRLSDQIATNRGAGSDTVIYVGNFGTGMLFGDRMMMTIAANPFLNWSTAQISVRVLERVAITVGIPTYFAKVSGVTV